MEDRKWLYRASIMRQFKQDVSGLINGFNKPYDILKEWELQLYRMRDKYPDLEEPIFMFFQHHANALKMMHGADGVYERMLSREIEKGRDSDEWYEPWCTNLRNEVELAKNRQIHAEVTMDVLNSFLEYMDTGDEERLDDCRLTLKLLEEDETDREFER